MTDHSFAAWQALSLFIVIGSITPGPNNILLLQGGLRKGYRGCLAHIAGIELGSMMMIALSYLGIAALLANSGAFLLLLKTIGSLYLLWLARHIAYSGITPDPTAPAAPAIQRFIPPLSLIQATLFQWINPKLWLMVMLLPGFIFMQNAQPLLANAPVLLLFLILNTLCISVWAAGGQWLRRLLHQPRTMRAIKWLIVVATFYCAVSLWL